MKYEDIKPISREEASKYLETGSVEEKSRMLLQLAYHHDDWRWVQSICLEFLEADEVWLKRNAITCFGHLARIHGEIDEGLVRRKLEQLKSDPELEGFIEDTLGDFEVFLQPSE